MKRLVRYLAILYLIALLVLWGLIQFDTGTLWPVTLFLFSPRWVVAGPLVVLVPLTLAFQFRLAFAYVLHCLIIILPIMDYRIDGSQEADLNGVQSLKVMTCNVGGGKTSGDQLMTLVKSNKIDVLMLQECSGALSNAIFEQLGWAYRQGSNIAVGSRFDLGEMQILARHPPSNYNVIAAISCELRLPVETPAMHKGGNDLPELKSVRVVSVHFPTFRPAFEKALAFDIDAGHAINEQGILYRDLVERALRELQTSAVSTVIAGDFNAPVESAFYRDYWSKYQNALSSVGTGLGYTKHTRFHGIRIDHVLADDGWDIASAIVGPDLGGDHRPVIVELSLTR